MEFQDNKKNISTSVLPDVFVLTIINKEFPDSTDPQFTFGSYSTIKIFTDLNKSVNKSIN